MLLIVDFIRHISVLVTLWLVGFFLFIFLFFISFFNYPNCCCICTIKLSISQYFRHLFLGEMSHMPLLFTSHQSSPLQAEWLSDAIHPFTLLCWCRCSYRQGTGGTCSNAIEVYCAPQFGICLFLGHLITDAV